MTEKTLQLIAVMAAALKAGHGLAESFIFLPIIVHAPSNQRLHHLHDMYNAGRNLAMSSIAITSASFAYLAYTFYPHYPATRWRCYAGCVALMLGMGPVTLAALEPINKTLFREERKLVVHEEKGRLVEHEREGQEYAEGMGQGEGGEEELSAETVDDLLRRWALWNGVRSMLPLATAILGLGTALW